MKSYRNDELLLKMSFNSFKMTKRVKISEKTCMIYTKHDVYTAKCHVIKQNIRLVNYRLQTVAYIAQR